MAAVEQGDIFASIALLRDSAETPLFQVQRLTEIGVQNYTPAGILYLLSVHPETAPIVEQLTGLSAETVAEEAKRELVKRYRGMSNRLTVSEEIKKGHLTPSGAQRCVAHMR